MLKRWQTAANAKRRFRALLTEEAPSSIVLETQALRKGTTTHVPGRTEGTSPAEQQQETAISSSAKTEEHNAHAVAKLPYANDDSNIRGGGWSEDRAGGEKHQHVVRRMG